MCAVYVVALGLSNIKIKSNNLLYVELLKSYKAPKYWTLSKSLVLTSTPHALLLQ